MNIPLHPAPGMGDLLPGFFAVPQNPITDGPITYHQGIGDILPGSFVVPQNPIKDFTSGQVKLIGQSSGHDDCHCGGACNSCSSKGMGKLNGHLVRHGMGDISTDFTQFSTDLSSGNIMTAIQDPILGLPVWGWAAIAAAFVFMGGKESHYSRARRAVRAY